MTSRHALIFGISGQDGALLAAFLQKKGYEIVGTSRTGNSQRFDRLVALGICEKIEIVQVNLLDDSAVRRVIQSARPSEIYHLAAQSSVGLSFEQPGATIRDISLSTLHILEAVRTDLKTSRVFLAGSGETFGFTGDEPADEDARMNPQSPYAVAKASARFIAATYRSAYDMHLSTGILFPHESPLRDTKFVTKKIATAAKRIAKGSKERLRLGNLSVERDWGWAPEYVDAMWRMLQRDEPGDFILATGRAITLEQFVATAFGSVGLNWREHVDVDPMLFRPTDPIKCRADPTKALEILGWRASTPVETVIRELVHTAEDT